MKSEGEGQDTPSTHAPAGGGAHPLGAPIVEVSPADGDDQSVFGGIGVGGQNPEDAVSMGNGAPPQLYVTNTEGADLSPTKPATPVATSIADLLMPGGPMGPPAEEIDPEDLPLEEQYKFRLFTPESYDRLLIKEEEDRRLALEKKDKPAEGRLVDGELKFDDDGEDGPPPDRDPLFIEGNNLPDDIAEIFPSELYSKPLEEIDKYLKAKVRNVCFINFY